jgi:hypothetical protein
MSTDPHSEPNDCNCLAVRQAAPQFCQTPGTVSRRDNAAMGPNSESPSPRPRRDSYGPERRDARGHSSVCSFRGEGEDQGRIRITVVKLGRAPGLNHEPSRDDLENRPVSAPLKAWNGAPGSALIAIDPPPPA